MEGRARAGAALPRIVRGRDGGAGRDLAEARDRDRREHPRRFGQAHRRDEAEGPGPERVEPSFDGGRADGEKRGGLRERAVDRVAVLTSGGLDSAVLVADLARNADVFPLYVEFGLAWEAAEQK